MRWDRWFYIVADQVSRDELLARSSIEGDDEVRRAVGQNRGVIALLSHHGSHDLLPILMCMRGYRCAGVRVREDRAARAFMRSRLARAGPELAAFETALTGNSPRQMLRWLNQGAIVGCAVDVVPPTFERLRSLRVAAPDGSARSFLTGPIRLARRCRTPLLQAFLISETRFRFRIIVRPLRADASDEHIAAEYTRHAIQFEREHPDHLSRF